MARAVLAVYSQPATSEQEAEYNRWYDQVHIPQIVERVAGVKTATRYQLSATQIVPPQERPQRKYLTLYEVEADDIAVVRDRLVDALDDGTFDWSDALDMAGLGPIPHFYEPAH